MSDNIVPTYVQRLGLFVSSLQVHAIPESERERLGSFLLYAFCVAMADHGDEDPVQAALLATHNAPGRSSIIGRSCVRSAPDAAAVNGGLMTARSQTDTHPDSGGHVGCVVIPAALAVAQQCGASVEDVIAGLAAGYEVVPRIGRGSVAAATARGMRGTSIYGVFGAAAACARVMRLDPERTAHALSLAANYAAGLTQCFEEGTPEAVLHVAHAARAGVMAALLAEQGVRGAALALEGRKGFYHAFADGVPQAGLALHGWSLSEIVLKPSPGCVINQIPVQTLLALVRRYGVAAEDVETITVRMHPENASYPGIGLHGPFPARQGAIMSAPFMLQLALENGRVTIRDFLMRHGSDPIHERSRKVTVEADPTLKEHFTCRIGVKLRGGRTLTHDSCTVSSIAFDSAATAALCRVIAEEWPTTVPDEPFARLEQAVTGLVRPSTVGAVDALFVATKLVEKL